MQGSRSFAKLLPEILRLQESRRYRDERGLFFVEGVRHLVRVLESGRRIKTLIYSDRLTTSAIVRKLFRNARRAGTNCENVTPEEFRQISRAERASGAAAIVVQEFPHLSTLKADHGLCWIVLSGIRSPGNFGTLMRTSEAVGGAGFLLLHPSIDPYHPTAVLASMGAIHRQIFVRTDLEQLMGWAKQHHCSLVGATPAGAELYTRAQYPRPLLLVLGEERSGIDELLRKQLTTTVRIPMKWDVDSLNVAMAGTLLLYEIFRADEATGIRRISPAGTD